MNFSLNSIKLSQIRKLVLIHLLVFWFIGSSSGLEWKQIIKEYGQAVCLIEIVENGKVSTSGSGFLFSADGKVLTNAHVVKPAHFDDKQQIRIKFSLSQEPEKTYYASVVKYLKELDLSVLSIPEKFNTFCRLGSSTDLQLMDDILIIGYPLGKSIKTTPGSIQAFQTIHGIGKMLDISADVDPGNSGGPVFNESGEIIGIVTAGIRGFNFNLALPVNLVNNFLKATEEKKTIAIVTDPEGARVFINGQYKGKGPVEVDYYGTDFELQVEKESYISQTKTVNRENAKTGEVSVTLEKYIAPVCMLSINSSPEGAIVLIDNNEVGRTPLEIEVDRNSKLRLRLIKKRYDELFKEIEIGEIKTFSVFYKLTK